MPVQRTEIEMAKMRLFKSTRAIVGLKHRLEADNELNVVLPQVEAAFDASVMRGELPDASVTAALAVVLGE